MYSLKTTNRLAVTGLVVLALLVVVVPLALAQGQSGAVQLPPFEPRIDQLGNMDAEPAVDRVWIGILLFLQVILTVCIAIALAGHWPWIVRKKKSS